MRGVEDVRDFKFHLPPYVMMNALYPVGAIHESPADERCSPLQEKIKFNHTQKQERTPSPSPDGATSPKVRG